MRLYTWWRNFDDLERDSNFDENDTIGNNNDVVGANGVIDDTELHNLDENDNCGIQ